MPGVSISSQGKLFVLGWVSKKRNAPCWDFFRIIWSRISVGSRWYLWRYNIVGQIPSDPPRLSGAFLSLGVERDVIGDILVGEGLTVAFLREEMGQYFAQNITKIGRVGVKTFLGWDGPLPLSRKFIEMSGVVASQRLDCLTAFLCRTSRDKAAHLVSGGMVSVNHRETLSGSSQVKEGDQISIRRQGRFVVDQLGPLTSKGRLVVKCRKYQ